MQSKQDKHRKRIEALVANARHMSKPPGTDNHAIIFRDGNGHFVFELYLGRDWTMEG